MNLENLKLLAEKRIVFLATGILVLFSVFVFMAVLSLRNTQPSKEKVSNQEVLTPQEELEGEEQAVADYEANKILEDFYKTHPWYDKFPIEEEGLFIAFSPGDEEFFVGIYLNGAKGAEAKEKEASLKQEALSKIRSAGADPSKFKVTYEVYD